MTLETAQFFLASNELERADQPKVWQMCATGRKIVFVTNRRIILGEAYFDTQSQALDLTAGMFEITTRTCPGKSMACVDPELLKSSPPEQIREPSGVGTYPWPKPGRLTGEQLGQEETLTRIPLAKSASLTRSAALEGPERILMMKRWMPAFGSKNYWGSTKAASAWNMARLSLPGFAPNFRDESLCRDTAERSTLRRLAGRP